MCVLIMAMIEQWYNKHWMVPQLLEGRTTISRRISKTELDACQYKGSKCLCRYAHTYGAHEPHFGMSVLSGLLGLLPFHTVLIPAGSLYKQVYQH